LDVLIRMIERSLVYPIPSRERGDWRPRWLRPQNVWFRAADETKLHGWYIPHAEPKRLVVFCHGNGEHVADQANLMFRMQSHLQATIFVFDYRGYGRSRGKPYEKGCIADGLAAQRWLAEKEGVSTEDITVIGRSIGGGVATAMAAEQGARALVLENTFSKLTEAAAHQYPYLPVRLVMRNHRQVSRPAVPVPRHGGRHGADGAGQGAVRGGPHEVQAVLRGSVRPPQRQFAAEILCGAHGVPGRSGSRKDPFEPAPQQAPAGFVTRRLRPHLAVELAPRVDRASRRRPLPAQFVQFSAVPAPRPILI
jgi:pimeloyl-ACP methyl ester carboxylesterase